MQITFSRKYSTKTSKTNKMNLGNNLNDKVKADAAKKTNHVNTFLLDFGYVESVASVSQL